MHWRKLNRVLHRDLGYFFFGMTVIYALSGIALNHRHEWNPNYIITQEEFFVDPDGIPGNPGREYAEKLKEHLGITAAYRTHLLAGDNFRVFIEGGSVSINIADGNGNFEIIRKRPVFNQLNFLHYNTPRKLWTWFSDLYAAGLILIAITGLFILKGKNGITGRGAWLTAAGLFIPLIFLYLYL